MKKLKEMKRLFSVMFAATAVAISVSAEDVEIAIQGDLVSSYVWRGMYQTGASIQPTLGVGYKGLSLTAWGSTDFDGASSSDGTASKEVDLTLAYAFEKGLTISVSDYWWAGQGANRYFHYGSGTAHYFEAGICYELPCDKFPLSIGWYTMFAGGDKNIDGDQNYSSYLEFNYPFSVKAIDLNATVGMSPYKSQLLYGCNSFAVTNVAIKGTYTINVNEHLSIPLFSQLIFNPRASDAHIVFGVSFVPSL